MRVTQAPSRSYRGARGVKSRTYRWRKERCPFCDMRYVDLKTGLTWTDVQAIARKEHEDGKRHHYSRGTVLGIWHQYKQHLWEVHILECKMSKREEEECQP